MPKIGGDIDLRCTTHGDVSFSRVCVAGNATVKELQAFGWQGSVPELVLRGSRIEGEFKIQKAFGISAPVKAEEIKLLRAAGAPGAPGWQIVEGFCVTDQLAGVAFWLWNGDDLCLPLGSKTPSMEMTQQVGSRMVDVEGLNTTLDEWLIKERPTTRYDTPLRVQKTGGSRAAFDALRALDRRRAWPIGIRKSDEWREIDDEPGRSAQAIAALASTKDWQKEWTVRRARERRLSFYLNWTLMQGLIDTPDGQAVVSWLWDNSDRAQVLDGTSIPMHKFNEDLPPKLESDKQVKDYVRFFCDHLWVEAGGFMVVDDADDLPFNQKERDDRAGCVLPLHMLSRDVTYNLTGTLAHAGHLFNVEFRLHPSGLVENLKDTQIEMDEATVTVKWRRPFLVPVPELPSPPAKPLPPYEWPEPPLVQGNWNDLAVEAKRLFQDALNSAAAHARVRVQLAASHARVLNDDFGRNWGDRTLLRLGGFTYDQIDRVEPDARPDTGKPAARRREDDAAKLLTSR